MTFAVQLDGQFVTVKGAQTTSNGATEEYPIPVHVLTGKECIQNFLKIVDTIVTLKVTNHKVFLVAHAGNIYDHLFAVNYIPKHWLSKYRIATSSKLKEWQFEIPGTQNTVLFKDTFEYTATALKKLAVDWPCGPKLEFEREEITELSAECIQYCQRDTAIVAYMCKEILPEWFDTGRGLLWEDKYGWLMYYSQAHIAYNMMIKMCPEEYFYCPAKEFYEFGKQSYFGARCDSTIYGQEIIGELGGYDISSLYPSGMNNPMPKGKHRFSTYLYSVQLTGDIQVLWQQKPFVCEVTLYKPCADNILDKTYGILPVKINDSIVYCCDGEVQGVYTCVDICAAIQDGWQVKSAKNFLYWEGWTTVPAEFYQQWFKIKQTSKHLPAKYWFSKIVLNSSIGKFCQKIFNKQNDNTKPGQLGWFCLSYTRLAHIQIKKLLKTVNCKEVYYGDTDSIFVDKKHIDQLEQIHPKIFDSKTLGTATQVTGEREQDFDQLIVLGKKSYCMCKQSKLLKTGSKGLNKKCVSLELYQSVLATGSIQVKYQQPKRWLKLQGDSVVSAGVSPFFDRQKIQQITVPAGHVQLANRTIVQTLYVNYK